MSRTRIDKPKKQMLPRRLCKSTIVAWARKHRRRSGAWPTLQSGPIPECPGDTWGSINAALCIGERGLAGGLTLEELLRGYQFNPLASKTVQRMRLTESLILKWAEEYLQRTGRLPHQHAGVIDNSGGLTWMSLNVAMERGYLGLPGGSSIAKLLRKRKGTARRVNKTAWSVQLILNWADAHYDRAGKWPTARSGPIPESPGTTWQAVMTALNTGGRGFKGGTTLGQVLAKHRGFDLRKHNHLPLTVSQILAWADAHHDRTGRWPNFKSGAISGVDGESWVRVRSALFNGNRGLPKSSLAKLLAEHRGVRNSSGLPDLTEKQILQWADAYFQETGKWPHTKSGPIQGSEGETWATVDNSLRSDGRGLRGGMSLGALLQRKRGVEPKPPIKKPRVQATQR